MGRFASGWELTILGMGTVFLMLFLLSVVLKFMGKYLSPKKALVQPITQISVATEDDLKTQKVAAVMAAIQLVMGDSEYKVISIKPVSSSWKQSLNLGREEIKYGGRKGK